MRRRLLAAPLLAALVIAGWFAAVGSPFHVDSSYPPADTVFETQMCAAINTLRAQNGLPPYQTDQRLQLAAENKARDMARWLYMDHDRPATPDGQPAEAWTQSFYDAGYPSNAAFNQNAAYGFTTPQSVVDAWGSDVGHRGNMLSSAVGVGCGVAWADLPASVGGTHLAFQVMDAGNAPLLPSTVTVTTSTTPTTTTVTTTTDSTGTSASPIPAPGQRWQTIGRKAIVTLTAVTAKAVTYVTKTNLTRTMKIAVFVTKFQPA